MIREDVRKGFSGALYNYLGLFFEKVVTVFVTVYVIRQLPIVDFGVFNLFQDTIALVGVIFSFGIPSLIERFLPELYERGLFKDLRRWVKRALLARFLLGLLGASVCVIGRSYLGEFLNSDRFTDLLPIFAIGLVFAILNETSQIILDTFLLQKRRNVIRMIVSVIRAGCYFFAIASGHGLIGVLWGFSLSALIGSTLFIHTLRHLNYPQNVVPRTEGLGELTPRLKRYGAYSYLNEMGGLILNRRINNYLISSFLNPTAVGIYSFAARLVDMLLALTPLRVGNLIISTILFRQFADNPTPDFLQRRFNLLCKLSLYLTLPFLVALVGLNQAVTQVIDPKYVTASYVLALTAFFEIFNVFAQPIALMAQTTEKVEVQLYSKIGAVYHILSALILIPRYGPVGAAWATGTSTLMKNALMFLFLRRQLPLQFPVFSLLKLFLAGFAVWVFLKTLSPFILNIFCLIGVAALGCLIFYAVSKLIKPFDRAEIASFEKAFGRKLWFV